MAASSNNAAQQARSKRYGIAIRDDGNVTKPGEWESLSDSQFADPVNYMYPIPDKKHAISAKSYFTQHKDKYDTNSQSVVRGRINRLSRKYGVDPLDANAEIEPQEFEKTWIVGRIELENVDGEEFVHIPAARVATFKHPWYGELYFDQDFYESMIDNFNTGVLGTDVAINAEHSKGPYGDAALGWIEEPTLSSDGTFDLKVKPTPTGKSLFGNEYRYASMEVMQNFIDQETGIEYGPTLVGCAITNRPFVHRNDAIDPILSFDRTIYDEVKPEWERVEDYTGKIQLDYAGTDSTTADSSAVYYMYSPIFISETEQKGGKPMPEKNDTALEQPTTTQIQALELPDGTQVTAADVQALMATVNESRQKAKQADIQRIVDTAKNRGVAPAVLSIAEALLDKAEPDAQAVVKLEDGVEVNTFNAIAKLLEIVPGKEMTEKTETIEGEKPKAAKHEKVELSLDEAENMAREARKRLNIGSPQQVELAQ